MTERCKYCPHRIGDTEERPCIDPKCHNWIIERNPKPIPSRRFDWDFIHKEYDGENKLFGTASSPIDAMNQITDLEADLEILQALAASEKPKRRTLTLKAKATVVGSDGKEK